MPSGFMRLSRACLTKMVLAHPQRRFRDTNSPAGYAHALFDNIHIGDDYWGEDFSFCKRWRDIGGTIWIDPELVLGHCGLKTFTGSIGEWLKARPDPDGESSGARRVSDHSPNSQPLEKEHPPMGAMMNEDRFGVISQALDVGSVAANTTEEDDFTVLGLTTDMVVIRQQAVA